MSVVAGYLVGLRVVADESGASAATTAATSVSVPVIETTGVGPSALASPATTTQAPGIGLTLHEHSSDPSRIVAYRNERGVWLRGGQGGAFTEAGVPADDVAASPDGAWLAVQSGTGVMLVGRGDGRRFAVQVPSGAVSPTWDRASSRLLFTVSGKGTTGFAVLDVATRQVTTVVTEGDVGPYAWTPGGDGVVAGYDSGDGDGLRFRDLRGRQTRTMPWTGASLGRMLFSPSGRLMLTTCPSGGSYCAWDAATGVRVATYVNSIKGAEMWGWYGDDHLMILDPTRTPHEFVAIDFREGTRRLLATLDAAGNTPGLRLARAAR
ncbi:hypothetical protein HII36_54250 [Nonomuraea sp. NN258]|uniref:WD40 repeat domain-containing protein n=1 Tax=Nonomuraea antri TaxID=2730852 RepID=UPI001569E9F7|nr:WD40 repeat domain-containing protein [Nonomuraea antri]NRQ40714.1 hypothetical protein [Nonomuraea antri]